MLFLNFFFAQKVKTAVLSEDAARAAAELGGVRGKVDGIN